MTIDELRSELLGQYLIYGNPQGFVVSGIIKDIILQGGWYVTDIQSDKGMVADKFDAHEIQTLAKGKLLIYSNELVSFCYPKLKDHIVKLILINGPL